MADENAYGPVARAFDDAKSATMPSAEGFDGSPAFPLSTWEWRRESALEQ